MGFHIHLDYHLINFILDFILIGASIWMIMTIRNVGGFLQESFTTIAWGAIILGTAHLIETITFDSFGWSIEFTEFIHRLIVLLGFVIITFSFLRLTKLTKGTKGGVF